MIIWTLFYDRQVTAYLSTLRGTQTGQTLHKAIIALQKEKDPSQGCQPVSGRPSTYWLMAAKHRIAIEIRPAQKGIGVMFIERT